ncbi:MAG TPA: DUF2207 domain-containing protein [Thermoanaerobaculia bacterium]|nr:DUF2207 domain-containing protein [Thermoanaerobaculia bacterium]
MMTSKRLAAVLPLLLLATAVRAQDRSLHWDELAVQARLDAEGTLHVRERQTMVFTGDWNGGERQFNLALGHRLKLVGLFRVDPATGREIPLVQDDQISQVDQYDWADNSTLRWRSRLPSDPPFDGAAITYVLDYRLSNILRESGGVYRLFHNFVFPDRAGVIERFVLDLELDPQWLPLGAVPAHLERQDLQPGESVELEARLEYRGEGTPAASRMTPAPLRYALFTGALAAITFLYLRFRRHEESRGRYEPPEAPADWDEGWLQENVFRYRPEEAGALWDQRVGPPEVAAMLARLVEEGKLASEVRSEGILFRKEVLHLRLLVDRNSLLAYERRLIDKLFFGGRTETSTAEVRDHYRRSGFNPASLIEGDVRRRLENLPPMRGRNTPGPGLRRSLFLLLATLALFGLGAIPQWEQALGTAAVAAFGCTWLYVPSLIAAFAWRKRTENLDLASLSFLVPGLLAFALCALLAFFDDWLAPWRLFVQPGLFSVMALALLPVTIWSSLLNNAQSRETPEAVAFRKRLGAARRMLRRELASPTPRLRDEWLPYLLAFGLQSDMDRWFRAFGGTRSGRGSIASSTSSWGGSSGGGSWTGGGGAFGGAGSTASWAAAATGMATGVSAASSSGGGGGGGGSSGGGGGGGW